MSIDVLGDKKNLPFLPLKFSFQELEMQRLTRLLSRTLKSRHAPSESSILEKINKSALRFLEPLTVEKTYEMIVREVVRVLGVNYGTVFVKKDGTLQRVYTSYPPYSQMVPRKNGYTYKAFRYRKTFLIHTASIQEAHPEVKEMPVRTIIFIPLSYQRKSVGVLNALSLKKENFTQKELEICKLFGSMASLAIMKAELTSQTEKALKTRDLFMSMAAHELKTPLTTISGYIQLLHSKFKNETSSEARWVNHLMSETQRLNELVEELLQTNRIKSGQLQYTWRHCSLREILRQTVESFQFTHPNRLIFFQDEYPEMNDMVIGDFSKLRQVFDNLLDNAGKYSPSDTPIRLGLRYKAPYFHIEIEDQGEGIPTEELPHVFDEFYKVRKKKGEEKPGMGLGLFLVKSIVTQHQGQIKVHSKDGAGTKVEIKLRRIDV